MKYQQISAYFKLVDTTHRGASQAHLENATTKVTELKLQARTRQNINRNRNSINYDTGPSPNRTEAFKLI